MTEPLRRPAKRAKFDCFKNETEGAFLATLRTANNATFIVSVRENFLNFMLDGNAARFIAGNAVRGSGIKRHATELKSWACSTS